MKKILLVIAVMILICVVVGIALARDVYVRGYYRSDGTYVKPHYRTAPDNNPWNNYSTWGNVNPYTGERGYEDPYRLQSPNIHQYPKKNRHYYDPWGSDD